MMISRNRSNIAGFQLYVLAASNNFCSATSSACHGFDNQAASGTLNENSQFVGVGPRVAVEGQIPLQPRWGIDYMAGLAVLFGDRSVNESATGTLFNIPGFPNGIQSASISSSSTAAVWNVDASAALSYQLTEHAKLSGGIRLDNYWNALATYTTAGSVVTIDRLYWGPYLRLTGQF